MDEGEALARLSELVSGAGDDAGVVDGLVFTIDMLHERTDFPPGVTRYTAGWRAVGASLSDVAAMGGTPHAAVAAYGAPRFDSDELDDFVRGARDVCAAVDAEYIGGDLDTHDEFTVATAAVGHVDEPIRRSGASPGERVYTTGTLGRTAVAMDHFETGDHETGNALFRFPPRVAVGRRMAGIATAMIDSSDGLARSLHQLAAASGCGFDIDADAIPRHPELSADDDRALFFGEDFELVFTAYGGAPQDLAVDVPITDIGQVTDQRITIDGEPLPDRGYGHGGA